MVAPIQSYGDSRLYGTLFVTPFSTSYQWLRTITHPFPPNCHLITEVAFQALKLVTGLLALTVTWPFALVGRVIQVAHFHSLDPNVRDRPREITINGWKLPRLIPTSLPDKVLFHGTSDIAVKQIMRWGFDVHCTSPGSKLGYAVYTSSDDTVPATYGPHEIHLKLHSLPREIVYLKDEAWEAWITNKTHLENVQVMATIYEVFRQNGIIAVRYDLDHYGKTTALAILDPSRITILKVANSRYPQPPPIQSHQMELLIA